MATEPSVRFDAQATASVLRAGGRVALASNAAAVLTLLPLSKGGTAAWIAGGSLLFWCAVVYLAVRVAMDARFFELLADERDADELDAWLDSAGLKKRGAPRTMADRRRGALRLWLALTMVAAAQIGLIVVSILSLLA